MTMCLMRLNQITVDALQELTRIGENPEQMCEKRMYRFAQEANPDQPGPYDNQAGALRHMPDDLKGIRHYRIGKASRHRIYLTGSHKNCSYSAWYIKDFKKSGREVEGGKAFNKVLRAALADADRFWMIYHEEDDRVEITDEGDGANPPAALPLAGPENPPPSDSR